MHQSIIDLFDEYTHKPLARRVFLERLLKVTGSVAAAQAALALLESDYAKAAVVPEGDLRISTGKIDINNGAIQGYTAFPKGMDPDAARQAVIVIHENRGLTPHIKDVARHMATDGFFAVAPDFLSGLGGTPEDEDKAREVFTKLKLDDAVAMAQTLIAGFKGRAAGMKVGAVGFCWGGGLVNAVATSVPELDAGVAYYGIAPALDKVWGIKAAMLMHYAGLDQRVNATMSHYEAALKAAGVRYQMQVYDGVNHAFNNDTSTERYNAEAAALAWQRTVAFFKANL